MLEIGGNRVSQQCALAERWIKRTEGYHLALTDAAMEVEWSELSRMVQSRSGHNLAQCLKGIMVQLHHPLGLVLNHNRILAMLVLGRNAHRTLIGMAGLGLGAA